MTRQSTSQVREAFALALAFILALGVIAWAPAARAQDGDQAMAVKLENAEFRWGINRESGGRAFDPTAFNLLMAGSLERSVKRRIVEDEWSSRSGNVTIEKRWSSGKPTVATFKDTSTDRSGEPTTIEQGSYSGLEMVFRGGSGTVDRASGVAHIKWTGTVTVVYYSGDSIFMIHDPELIVDEQNAKVVATISGYTAAQVGDAWREFGPTSRITIADLSDSELDLNSPTGFSSEPRYYGVNSGQSDQVSQDSGSFPVDFVDAMASMNVGRYWYSSGSPADKKKPPLPLSVSWDADNPADVPDGGSGSQGVLGRVLDDTVEDILRSAGTDVADTAAAWMDEAWKPAQPGAVNDARAGGGDASAPAANVAGDTVVDEEFATHFDDQYSADTPMTAGTVGAVSASSPATSSGGSSGNSSAAAPTSAPASVAAQGAMPVAANLPLTEVAYSNNSTSSEAGNALPQWQWWVGGVLLALAAGLFYQVIPRKE